MIPRHETNYWKNWWMVAGAFGFLVLSVAQLAFLGDTEEQGDWINGVHGFLALIVLICALLYAQRAARELGLRGPSGAVGGA